MKKSLQLLFFISFISVALFAQKNMTTSEYYQQQHPGFIPENHSKTGKIKENSPKGPMGPVSYTYVGSFNCNDGPWWSTNPLCYTGQEAAALLFGGNPEDYATSTNANTTDPGTITFTCWTNSWGSGRSERAQDYKLDTPPPGYAYPGGWDLATSAYVGDHPFNDITYVWRVTAPPPVPISNWAIYLGVILIAAFMVVRYRRRLA